MREVPRVSPRDDDASCGRHGRENIPVSTLPGQWRRPADADPTVPTCTTEADNGYSDNEDEAARVHVLAGTP